MMKTAFTEAEIDLREMEFMGLGLCAGQTSKVFETLINGVSVHVGLGMLLRDFGDERGLLNDCFDLIVCAAVLANRCSTVPNKADVLSGETSFNQGARSMSQALGSWSS